jgi:hypothetical protein
LRRIERAVRERRKTQRQDDQWRQER